jgi:lipopolysaccharide/colanic/teichoic acid biosynthesis glycosyltransferase
MPQIYKRYGKRIFDLVLGIFALVIFSWLILLILFCYCITFQFPVFFAQTRLGKNDLPFIMWKFRTLSSEENKPIDERRFRLGDFLRAINLDELPQLWNVLAGEMSLVGPRPLPLEYEPFFTQEQRARHSVRPGITGFAQVYGKNSISWEQKFNYDLVYIKKITFKTDLKILLKTITLVLSMKRDESLLEEKFKG